MSDPVLLNDEQVRRFIVNGYLRVEAELPQEIHETIYRTTNELFAGTGQAGERSFNPLNNILPMVPELRNVLEEPHVRGALTGILGPNYVMHPHRHCHPNFPAEPSDEGQGLLMGIHKDGHAGSKRPRHRVPRWAILFYFPHDCPVEMGPTCIIPGNQYLREITSEELDTQAVIPAPKADGTLELPEQFVGRTFVPCAGEAGSIWIMHFDIAHSVLLNFTGMPRYGMKFVFMRTEEPTRPEWDNRTRYWQAPDLNQATFDHEIVWTYVWNWLRGAEERFENAPGTLRDVAALTGDLGSDDSVTRQRAANALGLQGGAAEPAIPALREAMNDPEGPVRLNAAYALAAIGEAAIGPLIGALEDGEEDYQAESILHICDAAYALAALGRPAVPALQAALADPGEHIRGAAAFALGDMGPAAAEAAASLVDLLGEAPPLLRRHVISALGTIKAPLELTVPALAAILDDDDPETGYVASQALARIGPDAGAALPALVRALGAKGSYTRAFAAEALTRIGSAEALRALAVFLQTTRWFPYANRRVSLFSVDLSEHPVDLERPEEDLAGLLSDWIRGRGVPAPELLGVSREADRTYAIAFKHGGKAFADIDGGQIDFYQHRQVEGGLGEYR